MPAEATFRAHIALSSSPRGNFSTIFAFCPSSYAHVNKFLVEPNHTHISWNPTFPGHSAEACMWERLSHDYKPVCRCGLQHEKMLPATYTKFRPIRLSQLSTGSAMVRYRWYASLNLPEFTAFRSLGSTLVFIVGIKAACVVNHGLARV